MSTNIISNAVPYEDLTCAECNYGAVDNEGLCVIDESHIAVAWTTELPQRGRVFLLAQLRQRRTSGVIQRLVLYRKLALRTLA